jgi:CelD/BcsL family acetyltransferase involved in cellulose biosynthesis
MSNRLGATAASIRFETTVTNATTFKVHVDTDWSLTAPRWRDAMALCDATPFQRFDWLDAWYRHIAPAVGAAPRLVTVTDQATGGLVMLLPLVSVKTRTGQALQFADEELTDYNAPLLGPVRVAPGAEKALWRALAAALPGHAIASFRKMPSQISGRPNPASGAHISSVGSNALTLNGTFADFHSNLDRRVRMELERCWRVLQRETTVTFDHVRDHATALDVLDIMDRQQRERLDEVGSIFSLDEPAQAAFYRDRLAERLASGTVLMTVIRANGEVIAALYAIADGETAVVLRISNAGKGWSRVSPGRLVVHRAIECAFGLGHKTLDLSIGDYDYKRRFGVMRTPLIDLVTALSWHGRSAAAKHWAVGALRARPALDAKVRRLAGSLRGVVARTHKVRG